MFIPNLTLKVSAASAEFPGALPALYVLVTSTTPNKDNNKKGHRLLSIHMSLPYMCMCVCVYYF